jgi:predicted XRE-type DNA-binding protein
MQNESIPKSNRVKHFTIHPDPILAAEHLDITIVSRFWSKVDKGHGHSCWLWTGAIDARGGLMTRGGGQAAGDIGARKLSWLINIGTIPEGKRIIPSCKNPLCVNPAHFKIGGEPIAPPTDDMLARAKQLTEAELPEDQDPTMPPGFSRNFRERFWLKVEKTDTCWLWTASKNSCGYGWIGLGGPRNTSTIAAHIASWIMHFGPLPQGFDVLHNCRPNKDNPSCIRPEHLWIGTAKENAQDAADKQHERHGAHWNAQLTGEQVAEIRKLCTAGELSQREIAERFGVDRTHISRISHGHRWSKSGPKE